MKFEKTDYEKRLRDYLSSDIDQMYKDMLLNLFPELGESEDESIKNWCIAHFNEYIFWAKNDNPEYIEYLKNKVIPWLQKRIALEKVEKIITRGQKKGLSADKIIERIMARIEESKKDE